MADPTELTKPTDTIGAKALDTIGAKALDTVGAKARHDARAQTGDKSVGALFLVNGGGAVALLAFLQEIWSTQRVLAWWVLVGLAFFALGTCFAAPIYEMRARASWRHEFVSKEAFEKLQWWFRRFADISIACFVGGCLVVIIGGFSAWNATPTAPVTPIAPATSTAPVTPIAPATSTAPAAPTAPTAP